MFMKFGWLAMPGLLVSALLAQDVAGTWQGTLTGVIIYLTNWTKDAMLNTDRQVALPLPETNDEDISRFSISELCRRIVDLGRENDARIRSVLRCSEIGRALLPPLDYSEVPEPIDSEGQRLRRNDSPEHAVAR